MTIQIDKKITGFAVVKPEDKKAPLPTTAAQAPSAPEFEQMNEKVSRPEVLTGSTYKIKAPVVEHALYVTINDVVLNQGTAREMRRPFEIFINSKNMDQFQWVVALTRIMSAVFRKGGDIAFLVEELKSVFDPHGGYYKPGTSGLFVPSLIAEIGLVLETHLKMLGLIETPEMPAEQRALLAEKRRQYEEQQARTVQDAGAGKGSFPPGATMCAKCNTKAVVIMDGCATCLNCGYSKCG